MAVQLLLCRVLFPGFLKNSFIVQFTSSFLSNRFAKIQVAQLYSSTYMVTAC